MGRPKGSKNKGIRQTARSAWDTYNDWYDKYTKGKKAGWFSPKYTKAEFESQYKLAKEAKLPNPARTVARSQEYVDRKFEVQYKKLYGEDLPDLSTVEQREDIFFLYIKDYLDNNGGTYEEARESFEKYFY